jgi:hypothetical protein
VARHLVARHGVRDLLLASRRGAGAPGARELASELEGLGASVRIAECDVGEREQLRALLESLPAERPLRAVVHAAGVLDDAVVESLSVERVDRVLAPKAYAALHLHELTRELDLRAFVLFSSASATFGSPGQANYAAANAFLDALAASRHAEGLSATAIAWGAWTEVDGMADRLTTLDQARAGRAGIVPLTPDVGLALLDAATALDTPQLVAVGTDPATLRAHARDATLPALLRGLVRAPASQAGDTERDLLARRLAGAPEQERARIVLDTVRLHAAAVLGHASPQEVEVRQTFKELGFDSLAAIEYRNRLSIATGLTLSATLIFDYPSPLTLAGHLQAQLASENGAVADRWDPELDDLERRLESIPSGDAERLRIKRRLQAIVANLGDEQPSRDGLALVQLMSSASAEEVFDFIDEELRSE